MSVHSTYYEDEEEYRRDLAWEYRTEQAGLYHYDDDVEETYTCEECPYCKRGKRFAMDIVTLYGEEPDRETPRRELYLKENTKRLAYMDLCVRDIENIRQINTFDNACEDAIEEGVFEQ